MIELDIQVFPDSGVWHKPPHADRIDIVMQGGDGGSSSDGRPGARGEVVTRSFAADGFPDTMPVKVGQGGRPDGTDGYAIIVTELRKATL